jgi:PAS domain-containing protein
VLRWTRTRSGSVVSRLGPDSAQELAAVLDAVAEPVFIVGPDGVVRRANRAALAAMELDPVGLHRDALCERLAVTDSEGVPVVAGHFLALSAEPGAVARERLRLTRVVSGRSCTIEASATPLDGHGEVGAVVVAWRDTTDRDELLAMLLTERARLRSLADAMTDACAVLDHGRRVLAAGA